MKSKKSIEVRALLFILIAHLAVFLTAHIYYLGEGSFTLYLHLYATKILEFIFPALSAFIAVQCYAKRGVRSSLLFTLAYSIASFAYSIPFYYEYYVLEASFSSGDAILVSAVRSLTDAAAHFIHILALALISLCVILVIKTRRKDEPSAKDYLLGASSDASSLDFSSPTVQVSLAISVSELIYSLIFEIIDTVNFLGDAIDSLQIPELTTIVFNYVLLISLALITHFLVLGKTRTKFDA